MIWHRRRSALVEVIYCKWSFFKSMKKMKNTHQSSDKNYIIIRMIAPLVYQAIRQCRCLQPGSSWHICFWWIFRELHHGRTNELGTNLSTSDDMTWCPLSFDFQVQSCDKILLWWWTEVVSCCRCACVPTCLPCVHHWVVQDLSVLWWSLTSLTVMDARVRLCRLLVQASEKMCAEASGGVLAR